MIFNYFSKLNDNIYQRFWLNWCQHIIEQKFYLLKIINDLFKIISIGYKLINNVILRME